VLAKGGVLKKYVSAVGKGVATPDTYGSDRFLDLYAEDIDWREMPSAFSPEGRSGDRATVSEAVKEGQAALRYRKAHLHEVVAEGDRAAMRYRWEATVAIDGLPAPRGSELRAEVAQFITAANGKIARSYEYLTMLPLV
jgi:ketosteroid isomerase-like protein